MPSAHRNRAHVAAALAFTEHWMSTARTSAGGDRLSASFNAQSYGGRVEGGYRYAVLPGFGAWLGTAGATPVGAIRR